MDAMKPLTLMSASETAKGVELARSVSAASTEEKKKQFAKDFESIIITKLLDEMKNTIPDSELLEDEGSDQIKSMFNMFLARDVGQNGGMGLWKEIYKSISDTDKEEDQGNLLDKSI